MKTYHYKRPHLVTFKSMIEESLTDFQEVDQSVAQRTLNVYAYDCYDYAMDGNYFAYPDCILGETS